VSAPKPKQLLAQRLEPRRFHSRFEDDMYLDGDRAAARDYAEEREMARDLARGEDGCPR
jgi:hypothetical protein